MFDMGTKLSTEMNRAHNDLLEKWLNLVGKLIETNPFKKYSNSELRYPTSSIELCLNSYCSIRQKSECLLKGRFHRKTCLLIFQFLK